MDKWPVTKTDSPTQTTSKCQVSILVALLMCLAYVSGLWLAPGCDDNQYANVKSNICCESPKKRGGITWYSPLQSSTGVLNTAQWWSCPWRMKIPTAMSGFQHVPSAFKSLCLTLAPLEAWEHQDCHPLCGLCACDTLEWILINGD